MAGKDNLYGYWQKHPNLVWENPEPTRDFFMCKLVFFFLFPNECPTVLYPGAHCDQTKLHS